jgi:sterol desaturase/sphingolipid hydroxylase (fatty acid hydroxylase superfamily)
MEELRSTLSSAGTILAAMAALAALEAAIPLRARAPWNRAHLAPNLALSFVTFGTNALMGAALVVGLAAAEARGLGLLHAFALPAWAGTAVVVLGLDFAFYVTHVALHKLPVLWRFHRVHHADPAVDVTTTIRQHPGESLIRYAFLAVFALPLGASPAAFAVYRSAVALFGLLAHANLRVPPRLGSLLSLVFTWPDVHKVHHSRDARFTDTNYGNLVSWWDRAFGTFTPAREGRAVAYGLAGFDDPAVQSSAGLLALPFREPATSPSLPRACAPSSSPARPPASAPRPAGGSRRAARA